MSSPVNNPLQALLQQTGQLTSYFATGSRYYTVPVCTYTDVNGNTIRYVGRRFCPSSDEFSLIRNHIVKDGERLDNLANQYLGDPLQFWQLCDANDALDPDDLIEPGYTLRITLPKGIPGTSSSNA
jgi:nucleoid-associated protein YgaU